MKVEYMLSLLVKQSGLICSLEFFDRVEVLERSCRED